MGIVFRLAGSPDCNQGKVPSYADAVDAHFGAQRDHPVVKLARTSAGARESATTP